MRKASDATLLRVIRSNLKCTLRDLERTRNERKLVERQVEHYKQILEAIADGRYPGDLAKLAAMHAIAAWKGQR